MAKVIDCNTGLVLHEGMRFENVNGQVDVIELNVGILSGSAMISMNNKPPIKIPLIVRWFHPSFIFQHVAFLPS